MLDLSDFFLSNLGTSFPLLAPRDLRCLCLLRLFFPLKFLGLPELVVFLGYLF
jgi:hypothetical protein